MKIYYFITDDSYGMHVKHFVSEAKRDDNARTYMTERICEFFNDAQAARMLEILADMDLSGLFEEFQSLNKEGYVTWGEVDLTAPEFRLGDVDPDDAALFEECARNRTNDELEIDDSPNLSKSDCGAWVSAWIYVSNGEAGIIEEGEAA